MITNLCHLPKRRFVLPSFNGVIAAWETQERFFALTCFTMNSDVGIEGAKNTYAVR